MQDVGRGHAAGQRAVNGNIFGVNDVLDIDHGRDRDAAFIDPAIAGYVGMAVDDTRDHVLVTGVDYGGSLGNHDLLAHFGDLSVFHHNGAFEGSLG